MPSLSIPISTMLVRCLVVVLMTYLESMLPTSVSGSVAVGEVREYCLTEYFNASCPDVNDVILMTSAQYGRMRLGRCIRGDYNLGCSNDVIGLFDAQCSGRKSCDVSVRTLVDIRPCQRDFASFLEASFTCIRVLDLHMTSCPSPAGVTVTTATPVGFLSNTLYEAYSSLGRPGCPWVIRGAPGQRIELTLYTLHGLRTVATPGVAAAADADSCTKIVIVDGELNSMTSSNGEIEELLPVSSASSGSAFEFSLCVKRSRERRLYTSNGHTLTIHTISYAATHQPPSSTIGERHLGVSGSTETRFLLMYRLLGCPNLVLSDRAWIKPLSLEGDDVMVRCNDTLETWYLSCQGNQWIGHYDNCTDVGRIAMALGLGLVLGIFIAIIALCTICCVQHWCTRRPADDKPISELMVTLGHPQLLRAATASRMDNEGIMMKSSTTVVDYDGCTEIILPPPGSSGALCRGSCTGSFTTFGRPSSFNGRQHPHEMATSQQCLNQRHHQPTGSRRSSSTVVEALCANLDRGNHEEPITGVGMDPAILQSATTLEGTNTANTAYDGRYVGYEPAAGGHIDSDLIGRQYINIHRNSQIKRYHNQQQRHQCCRSHVTDSVPDTQHLAQSGTNFHQEQLSVSDSVTAAAVTTADSDSYPPGLRTPQ